MNKTQPSPSSRKITNPKLSLFSFRIRTTLDGQRPESSEAFHQEVANNATRLGFPNGAGWTSFIYSSPHDEDDEDESNYAHLSPTKQPFPLQGRTVRYGWEINGEIEAVRLHDVDAVDLTTRLQGEIDLEQLADLHPERCLLEPPTKSGLGKALLLYAKPPPDLPLEALPELAVDCARVILGRPKETSVSNEGRWRTERMRGRLLGSPLYLFYDHDMQAEDQKSIPSVPLLVWFDAHPETARREAEGRYYRPLTRMLMYRSKIYYSYFGARQCYLGSRSTLKLFNERSVEFNRLPPVGRDISADRVTKLDTLVKELAGAAYSFAKQLRDIKVLLFACKQNVRNYDNQRRLLEETSPEEQNNFGLLLREPQWFADQTQSYVDALEPWQAVFGQFVDSVRSSVILEEQALNKNAEANEKQRDTQRNLFLAALALGVSVSSVTAAVEPHLMTRWMTAGPAGAKSDPNLLSGCLDVSVLILLGAFTAASLYLLLLSKWTEVSSRHRL